MTYEYEMTLKFKVKSGQPLDPNFAPILADHFRDYEDGRYTFDVEQVQNGLSDCMKRAAQEAVEKAMQEKYGDETVDSVSGFGQTYRWYLESLDATPAVPHFSDEPTVAIERINYCKPFHDRHIPRRKQ
jgi:hypothetical protein